MYTIYASYGRLFRFSSRVVSLTEPLEITFERIPYVSFVVYFILKLFDCVEFEIPTGVRYIPDNPWRSARILRIPEYFFGGRLKINVVSPIAGKRAAE